MKTIGLIGGMSWESTLTYYRLINEAVKRRKGGYHSAKIVLYSVDFADIEVLQRENRWQDAADILISAAISLQRAGANCIVLCTNTMHIVAPQIQNAISIPFIHIVDSTAEAIKAANIKTVGLLATRFTMEQDFYVNRLRTKHNLNVLIPGKEDRDEAHRVIYEELVQGKVMDASRKSYLDIIENLKGLGAQAIIFGCTEIAMLLPSETMSILYFDTTQLHAQASVDYALT